jgi:hypothetical protein
VLGSTPSVEYLREPVTQSWLEAGNHSPLVDPATDRGYRDHSLEHLRVGRFRRLIKEVNPLLVGLAMAELEMQVILLHRHPCAVALSYHELGWTGLDLENRFGIAPSGDFWRDHGAYQALLLRPAADALGGNGLVSYEELTHDPEEGFSSLATRLDLEWGESSLAYLRTTLAHDDRSDPYSVQRDAAAARERWRSVLTTRQQKAIMAGYRQHAGGVLPESGRRFRRRRQR